MMTTGKLFPSGLRIESNLTHKSTEDKFVKQIWNVSIICLLAVVFQVFCANNGRGMRKAGRGNTIAPSWMGPTERTGERIKNENRCS